MFDKSQMENLMKNAEEMQKNLQKAQNEVARLEIEGSAGDGVIKVTMNGKHDLQKVSIDPSIINNKNMLEKMFVIAVNDATRKIEELTANKMMDGLSSGILDGLAGMNLPS